MKNKNIIRIVAVTALLLMVPLVAMQFTQEVNWSPIDFAVAGILLFSTGLAYELLAWKGGNNVYRLAAGVTIGTTFLLIWVNLAVGLIGSGPNVPNLLYIGVPVVLIIGAIAAHYQPLGMTRALFATALAQVLVPLVALIIEKSRLASGEASPDIMQMLGVTVLFVTMWIISALLFKRAGTGSQANTI